MSYGAYFQYLWRIKKCMKNYFIYYNRNPDGDLLEDCVTRAISLGTGLEYDGVANLLEITSKRYKCDKLCVCCYHNLLEDILCYECVYCNHNERVKDIAKKHKHNTLIIRIEGHLTCSVKGYVMDTWDCGNRFVDCYWIIT